MYSVVPVEENDDGLIRLGCELDKQLQSVLLLGGVLSVCLFIIEHQVKTGKFCLEVSFTMQKNYHKGSISVIHAQQ